MNFSPFGVPFTGSLPVTTQFAGGKLATTNGQVVGVLSAGENGVHYIRPVDASSFAQASPPHQQGGQQTQTLITLPITMPGAKPGDPQQTVQIQVVNPAAVQQQQQQQPKYHISQIPMQNFPQGATVLTVAYNSQQEGGIQILDSQQGLPEGVTVVAALQPQDLQLIQASQLQQHQNQQQQQQQREEDLKNQIQQQVQQQQQQQQQQQKQDATPVALLKNESNKDEEMLEGGTITVPANWQNGTTNVVDYLSRMPAALPLSLHQFLKFSAETIKRESQIESSPLSGDMEGVEQVEEGVNEGLSIVADMGEQEQDVDDPDKNPNKKKKKYKKKPPKPRRPKPGQVQIATALDGTTLFCCPECHMAYPEKELLEQHLVGHKIERRFICDICGAGLKRKEHLERHKLGHNPDRPFICSVCMKGFKRKEHLNLHFVIHSGQKTEICEECGKGFYRKDHLRKHARSHVTRRVKEELNQQAQQASLLTKGAVTIQAPTSQQIPIPIQIQVPQHHIQLEEITVGEGDDQRHQVSTVVLPTAADTDAMTLLPH